MLRRERRDRIFASCISGKRAGCDGDVNEGRRSFLHRMFVAVRAALLDVTDWVYEQCAGKRQIERLQTMLVERGLWDATRCRTYHGESPDKADLADTKGAWADVYLDVQQRGHGRRQRRGDVWRRVHADQQRQVRGRARP